MSEPLQQSPTTPPRSQSDEVFEWGSPGLPVPIGGDGQFERDRVCTDVLLLMTSEHLKEGLRHEGAQTTGLKADLARRLGGYLVGCMDQANGPTIRQLKYVLWLWRHGNVAGRYQLRWNDVNNKRRISHFIHIWKDR